VVTSNVAKVLMVLLIVIQPLDTAEAVLSIELFSTLLLVLHLQQIELDLRSGLEGVLELIREVAHLSVEDRVGHELSFVVDVRPCSLDRLLAHWSQERTLGQRSQSWCLRDGCLASHQANRSLSLGQRHSGIEADWILWSDLPISLLLLLERHPWVGFPLVRTLVVRILERSHVASGLVLQVRLLSDLHHLSVVIHGDKSRWSQTDRQVLRSWWCWHRVLVSLHGSWVEQLESTLIRGHVGL